VTVDFRRMGPGGTVEGMLLALDVALDHPDLGGRPAASQDVNLNYGCARSIPLAVHSRSQWSAPPLLVSPLLDDQSGGKGPPWGGNLGCEGI